MSDPQCSPSQHPTSIVLLLCFFALLLSPKKISGQDSLDVRVFTSDSINLSLKSELFWHVAVDKNNHLWFGTNQDGLITYDGSDWNKTSFAATEGHRIRDIVSDLDSNIWVASAISGPSSRSLGGKITYFNIDDSSQDQVFNAGVSNTPLEPEDIVSRLCYGLAVDSSNNVWAAHGSTTIPGSIQPRPGGVGYYTGDEIWSKPLAGLPQSLDRTADQNVMAVATNNDNAWVSVNRSCGGGFGDPCSDAYVLVYNQREQPIQRISSEILTPLQDGRTFVRAILIDKNDDVWLGFSQGGIAQYDKRTDTWIFYDSSNSNFPENAAVNFQAIAEDAAGRIWIGTTNGLVMHHNAGNPEPRTKTDTLKVYTVEDRLPSNSVTGMATQVDSLWITTVAGVARLYLPSEPIIKIKIIERGVFQQVAKVKLVGESLISDNEVTSDITQKDGERYASFYGAVNFERDIDELRLLDAGDQTIGYIDFKFRKEEIDAGRRKQAIVTLHNDLVTYQNHPIERGNSGWDYVADSKSTELYPVTMLLPPVHYGEVPSYYLDSIDTEKKPLLFVHGYTGSDRYWGESSGPLVDPSVDNSVNFKDYAYTSYPSQVSQLSSKYAIWEFYYPGDQSWRDSGFLLARDLKEITRQHNSQKVSVVAHSMGGLVVRSYIEKTAEAYLPSGSSTGKVHFDKDVDRVMFLGTPHHGSFGGTRLYWEIYINGKVQGLFSGKDPDAPAARDLGIGSSYLLELNDKQTLDREGVDYFQLSGTTFRGFIPGFSCTSLTVESKNHSDGIVAFSSGNLLGFGVPVGFLADFNHERLNNPDKFGIGEFEPDNKSSIPLAIIDYFNDGLVSRPTENSLVNKSVLTTENAEDFPSSTTEEGCSVNFDIGLPMVLLKDTDGNDISFKENVRFAANYETGLLELTKSTLNGLGNEAAGEWLYSSKNNYNEDGYKAAIFSSNAFPRSAGCFYSYSKPSSQIIHEGIGWSVPDASLKTWPVKLSLDVFSPVQRMRRVAYGLPKGQVIYKRSQTTYNDIVLSPHEVLVTATNQMVTPNNIRDANLEKAMADSIYNFVDCNVTHTTFLLDYGDQPVPTLDLVTPENRLVTVSDTNNRSIFFTHEPELRAMYFTIIDPQPGRWYVRIDESYTPDTSYHIAFPMSVTNPFNLRVNTLVEDSTSFLLRASLSGPTSNLASLTVDALWNTEAGENGVLTFNDAGIGADSLAGDGVYSSLFTPTGVAEHFVEVSATGVYRDPTLVTKADRCNFYRRAVATITPRTQEPTTAIDDGTLTAKDASSLKLYPNPAQQFLRVSFTSSTLQPWRVTIYSTTGQQYGSPIEVTDRSTRVVDADIRYLPKGLFFVVIQEADGRLTTQRFVKK